jgi:hypothetical protein
MDIQIRDNNKSKRIENSLKMLNLLKEAKKTNKRLTAKEIMKFLKITRTRSVYYYKHTLELFGYKINSFQGYDGGYELVLPEKLSQEDIDYLGQIIPSGQIQLFEKIKQLNKDLS